MLQKIKRKARTIPFGYKIDDTGNYLVPKEGDSGGVIFFSEKPNFDAYEIRNKDGIVYAVGLPFVTEDTLENIGGYELLVKNKDFGESRITIDNQSFIAPNNNPAKCYDKAL